MMEINTDLLQRVYNFFKKKTFGLTVKIAIELNKTNTKKIEKQKVHSHFTGNIWDTY